MKNTSATQGKSTLFLAVLLLALAFSFSTAEVANGYVQSNLVSNIPGLAAHTDSNLVNPWGISFSGTSPFWVSNNGSGLDDSIWNRGPGRSALVVTIPPASGGIHHPHQPARFLMVDQVSKFSGFG